MSTPIWSDRLWPVVGEWPAGDGCKTHSLLEEKCFPLSWKQTGIEVNVMPRLMHLQIKCVYSVVKGVTKMCSKFPCSHVPMFQNHIPNSKPCYVHEITFPIFKTAFPVLGHIPNTKLRPQF